MFHNFMKANLVQTLVLTILDYSHRLLMLSLTQVETLKTIQNKGMRAVIESTRNMSITAMSFCCIYPVLRYNNEWCRKKFYLKVANNEHHHIQQLLD